MKSNVISTKMVMDVSDVLKKIQTIKTNFKDTDVGISIPKTLIKDIESIENKLISLQKNVPGNKDSGASILKYGANFDKVSREMDVVLERLREIRYSDKDIKNNIGEISALASQWEEAARAVDDYAERIKSSSGIKRASKIRRYDKDAEEARDAMAEAATRGNDGRKDIKAARDKFAIQIARRKDYVTANWSPEKAKIEIDLLNQRSKELNAQYQSALRYSELQQQLIDKADRLNEEFNEQVEIQRTRLNQDLSGQVGEMEQLRQEAEQVGNSFEEAGRNQQEFEQSSKSLNAVTSRVKNLFSATTVFYTLQRVVRSAIRDFQELDKQFNEIAIVSQYSTKEMWSSFAQVNKMAQEYGVTTKNVVEVQNLYYHQGKSMAEVNKLTAQTLNLAKITGMDYEDATNKMTAALNAYRIAAEDANRVTDTVAALSANAATSSEELLEALTKTASIAANAGISLESTEVFLTKMIETTREAPENLGTALKTIIARFGQVKQEIDGEEVELINVNQVDTALKTVGISLLDTAGQIRDLEDVFMELSSIWDGLDRNTQRYIATIAAGSRQQSRFIAMMENYSRTLELTEVAQNSAGTGARQLAKSQESIESSLNRLKSTWQEFYAGFITSGMIKGVLEFANDILTFINYLNDVSPALGTIVAALTLWIIKTKIIDVGIKKLGLALGEGISTTSAFSALTLAAANNLNEEGKQALLASKHLDKYTRSIIEASMAEKSLGQATELRRSVQLGLEDENGNPTSLGKQMIRINEQRAIKKKKVLSTSEFLNGPRGKFEQGKENTLIKLFGGEKNYQQFLTNKTPGIKGVGKNAAGGIKTALKASGAGLKGIATSVGGTIASIAGSISSLLSVLWPVLAAVAAIGAAFVIWKTNFKASLDDTKAVKKLTEAQEEYNKRLQETNSLKEKSKKYQEYLDSSGNLKSNLSAEQMKEEQEIAKELVAEYPSLLEKIDEEGNYHLKNTEAIEKEIEAKERLTKQSADTYNNLRLKYAEKGIYTDTSTQAGQAIKNIQDYAATFGTEKLNKNEDLKEIAKIVDREGGFNKSGFYDIMEAYATGKKSSFNYRDFTDLFAGDIGKSSWEDFLQIIREENVISEDGEINEQAFTDALVDIGAYSKDNAEDVTKTFVALNEQLGGLYTQLLQGSAYEQSEIFVQSAKMQVDQFDFDSNVGDTLKTAISEAAVKAAKGDMNDQDWNDLGEQRDTLVENQISAWEKDFEALNDKQLGNIEKFLTEDNALATNIKKLQDEITEDDLKVNTADEMRNVLKTFWNLLPDDIKKAMPEMENLILNGEESVIHSLFEGISEIIDDSNIRKQIPAFVGEYVASTEKYTQPENFLSRDKIQAFAESLTGDQYKALVEKVGNLETEQIAPYLSSIIGSYNAKQNSLSFSESREQLKNALINTDFIDVTSVLSNMDTLQQLGYTTEEVATLMVDSFNGVADISGLDFETVKENTEKVIKVFSEGIEGMGALMEGSASSEQLNSYLSSMKNYYTKLALQGDTEAFNRFSALTQSIQATGKGFKMSTSAADEYGDSLYQTAIAAFDLQVSLLKAELALAKTNGETQRMIEIQSEIMMLEMQAANLDAMMKQTRNDKLVDDLSKAKDKADKLVDSLKALVDWLREFDRYTNLDKVIDSLEKDFDHLDFEINFSTNTDVLEKDLNKQITNINSQISANQGGIAAAKEEQAMWRDVISKRNSQYVSFDANGDAIVNAEKLEKLQREISQASEERQPILQAEYDEIMDNVEAYNKSKDKVEEYTKALEENFNELKDFLNEAYESITTVEEKLIKVRQEAEDRELEAVKERYEAIKEENDKYLENVQKMVDKERDIRDRADREEDVRDKEKKLAMMKMDTSGVYTNDIRALEEELQGDYQSLEDDAVDRAISELEEQYNTQAEVLDREVEYLENSLEYRREVMTEYNIWAQQMMMSGSDTVIAYLKANDQEYYTGTAAAQAQWILDWENKVAQGVAANSMMAESLTPVFNNLTRCQTNAEGFNGAVDEYSQNAIASNGEIEGTVESLTGYYESLADGVKGVATEMDGLKRAYYDAAEAAGRLKAAQDYLATGSYNSPDAPPSGDNDITGGGEEGRGYQFKSVQSQDWQKIQKWNLPYVPGGQKPMKFGQLDLYQIAWGDGTMTDYYTPDYDMSNLKYALIYKRQYATGGYVDYTGPAWVDGTKSHPEYMLNATQTLQFENLIHALEFIAKKPNLSQYATQAKEALANAQYNFHITVSQMASDYDVDQLVSRLEKKMTDASKYRNINILKKTN